MSSGVEPWTPVWRHRLLRPWLRTRVRVNGQDFVLPYVGGDTPFVADYDDEPWMGRLLARLHTIAPGAIIDVGTNVGQTLLMAKSIDRDWPYIGFEPNPACWFVTKELIRANRLPACQLVPLGLGESSEVLALYSNEATDGSASLIEGFRPAAQYARRQLVGVCSATTALVLVQAPGERVGVVKIDVEGAELEVLRGLVPILRRDRCPVVCEVLPVYDAATDNGRFRLARQQQIEAILAELGYAILRIHRDGRFEEIESLGIHGDLALTNYVFCPGDLREHLSSAMT